MNVNRVGGGGGGIRVCDVLCFSFRALPAHISTTDLEMPRVKLCES